jgi:hypothetical protein
MQLLKQKSVDKIFPKTDTNIEFALFSTDNHVEILAKEEIITKEEYQKAFEAQKTNTISTYFCNQKNE